jgi:tmRNA-binding protein
MAGKAANLSPRITNRRALHDFFIEAKIECGIVLVGSEVKSLRNGKAQLHEAFARIEHGKLILHNAHIDPYDKAAIVYNHEPTRDRILLVHKREIRKLQDETKERGPGEGGIGRGQGQAAARQAGDDQEEGAGPRASSHDDAPGVDRG